MNLFLAVSFSICPSPSVFRSALWGFYFACTSYNFFFVNTFFYYALPLSSVYLSKLEAYFIVAFLKSATKLLSDLSVTLRSLEIYLGILAFTIAYYESTECGVFYYNRKVVSLSNKVSGLINKQFFLLWFYVQLHAR